MPWPEGDEYIANADAIAAAIAATVPAPEPHPDGIVATSLHTKVRNAIATLENADTNWGSLSNAQKDAALRLAVRTAAKLARLVARQLDSD